MSGELRLTVVGNLTADPELRFTPAGAAVVSFSVATTPRTYDRNRNEWTDGETSYVRCQAWRQLAENVAESLHKGDRVIAVGTLREEKYETNEGEKRSTWRLTVDAIGPELTWATASPSRQSRGRQLDEIADAGTADELLDASEGKRSRTSRSASRDQ